MSLTINANHSSSYYLRNFYSSNRSAASTDSYRNRSSNHTLVLADSEALKKARRHCLISATMTVMRQTVEIFTTASLLL